ncbi:MAG: glutathione S-transferase C-terminal domain-containing protein [Nitrosomonas sp.]|nr:glutathione S-transferase C-terminal domain-containing protein [Nitrosomonas sp.]MDP1950769.1 glutathione S-transferase C-terminal domain-containing protein [Nitrosomonas sp.]
MDNQQKVAKLISFPPSADCELGRWVLFYHGINFVEKRHATPFFLLFIWLNGGKEFPLFIWQKLILDGVRPIIDHFDNLADPDRKLIPSAYANDIETSWQSFNAELGNAVVTWAYANLLPHRDIMVRPLSLGSPWLERFFVEHCYNIPKNLLWKSLKLDKAAADEALVIIQKKFLDVDKMLADGRKYLFGDRMTLADMAFATCGAPLVLPAGYGGYQYEQGPIPSFEQFPKELQEIISSIRQTPAGKFILRLYAEERYRGMAESEQ